MKTIKLTLKIIISIIPALFFFCDSQDFPLGISSPDQNLMVTVNLTERGVPAYSIYYKNNTIVDKSILSLHFKNGSKFEGFNLVETDCISHHSESLVSG